MLAEVGGENKELPITFSWEELRLDKCRIETKLNGGTFRNGYMKVMWRAMPKTKTKTKTKTKPNKK